MPNTAWRCEHPDTGDVKYAVREAHVDILELKGYVCELDPDPQFDVITIYTPDDNHGPAS
jgi:hypothetical protein